jgi:hypothetical protein
MPSSVKNNSKRVSWFTKWKAIGVLAVVVLLLAFDLSPFGGNMKFYSTWIRCGQKPVATAGSGYFNVGAAHYYEPSSFPGLHVTIDYFCTPLEAEQAGYSANPNSYSFPHLHKQ